MVEVGSLEIGGSIDTSEIERSLKSVERGFDDISTSGKSVEADFVRIGSSASGLVKSLGLISAGIGLVNLAKDAPATAGAMAKLEIGASKLQRSLGTALAPAFEKASEALNIFTSWVTENEPLISTFATGALTVLTDALQLVTDLWNGIVNFKIPVLDVTIGEGLKWIFDHFGAEITGALIGAKFGGLPGAAIGAGIGTVVSSFATGQTTEERINNAFGELTGTSGFSAKDALEALLKLIMKSTSRKSVSTSLANDI